MRTKNLAVALAVGLPLAAAAYVGWVYYSTLAEYARMQPPGPPSDPNAPPQQIWLFDHSPVDPADLHGTWTSRAAIGTNRRDSVLEFRPGGELVWTLRVTVGDRATEIVERYQYDYQPGPVLTLTPTAKTIDGRPLELRDAALAPKFWLMKWTVTDKSSFQLLTAPREPELPHLRFQKAPPAGEKKG